MGKGVEAGCARMAELLVTHLKPATETLLFRLSELQGRVVHIFHHALGLSTCR